MFGILPRSSDLNSVENIFQFLQIKLERKTLNNLIRKNFKKLVIPVKRTMLGLNTDVFRKVEKNGVILYVSLHLLSFSPSEKHFIIAVYFHEGQKKISNFLQFFLCNRVYYTNAICLHKLEKF